MKHSVNDPVLGRITIRPATFRVNGDNKSFSIDLYAGNNSEDCPNLIEGEYYFFDVPIYVTQNGVNTGQALIKRYNRHDNAYYRIAMEEEIAQRIISAVREVVQAFLCDSDNMRSLFVKSSKEKIAAANKSLRIAQERFQDAVNNCGTFTQELLEIATFSFHFSLDK